MILEEKKENLRERNGTLGSGFYWLGIDEMTV